MSTFLCLYSIFLLALNNQVFPSVLTRLGGSAARQGLFLSFLFLLLPLSSVCAGLLADRIGKKAVLIAGSLFLAIPFAASAFLQSYWARLIAVLSFGIGLGTVEGQASALLTDLHPGKERAMINLSQVFFCAGAAGGPFFISLSYRLVPDLRLRTLLLVVALFTSTVMIGFFFLQTKHAVSESEGSDPGYHRVEGLYQAGHKPVSYQPAGFQPDGFQPAGFRRILSDRTGRLLLLSIFIYTAPEMGTAGWLVKYSETVIHLQQVLAPLALTFFWGGLAASRFLVVFFFHSIKDTKLLTASLIITLLFQVLAFLVRLPLAALLCFFFLGFGMGTIWPTLISMAGSRYRKSTGSAVGIMVASSASAIPIIHLLIGLFSQEALFGLRYTLCGLLLFTATNLLIVRRIEKIQRDTTG